MLKTHKIGEVIGGVNLQVGTGAVENSYFDICINSKIIDAITIRLLKNGIEELGTSKGFKIVVEGKGEEIVIGDFE